MLSDCGCESHERGNTANEEDDEFVCSVGENDIENEQSESSNTKSHRLGAVLKTKLLWDKGSWLRVKFLGKVNEMPNTIDRIKTICNGNFHKKFWTNVCYVGFTFVGENEYAEIRIALNQDNVYYSQIGNQAKLIANDKPTMSLGFKTDNMSDDRVFRKVAHEFGHALGFFHEHQNPRRTFEFLEEQVIADLTAKGLTKEFVKINILDKVTAAPNTIEIAVMTDFDRDSIMNYGLKASWLMDFGGDELKEPQDLSATDILIALQCYPRPSDWPL